MINSSVLTLMVITLLLMIHSEVKVQINGESGLVKTSRNDFIYTEKTSANDLWVDAVTGDDHNDGLSPSTALRTIQSAADIAKPGTTVHIQPGVYRESIFPAQSGTAFERITYVAEAGSRTVAIRGSEPSSELTWIQLTSNTIGLPAGVDPTKIYYTDLSAWGLSSPPRFVVELNDQGEVIARLPLAREPDWSVATDWKYHEYWWAADGGSDEADCYPPTDSDPINCDLDSRSLNQLTDRHNDVEISGIEPGNLTTLGNLAGATLVVLDTNTGTFIFRRTIITHNVADGRITVNQNCEDGYGTGDPALGWGSKYYVEGVSRLLDSPGEWWYDKSSGRLYIWPRTSGNPANQDIEISRREDGFSLHNRSYITLDGMTIEFFQRNAVYASNDSYDKSHNDIVRNAILRYDNYGIWLRQYVDPVAPLDCSIDGFIIEDSEIAYIDTEALHIYSTWGTSSSAASFIRSGVLNTRIRHNEFHHLGFRTDSDGVGALIMFADRMRFEENHVHHVAHNGVQFMRSVVQSPNSYDFLPEEIKTGEILIRNNIFERACQNHTDCGALKISGTPPDRHVFRELLVTSNIFRDTFGWTYIAEKRGYGGGSASSVKGMLGNGLYVDNASGIYAYRNIAYNNAFKGFNFYGKWRDGDIVFYNNTSANSLTGFHFGGLEYDTHGCVNTEVVDNIIVNHEGYGIFLGDADGILVDTTIDHNLYYNNGWRPYSQGGLWGAGDLALDIPGGEQYYHSVPDIQAGTVWEDHGLEGNPSFWIYDFSEHQLFDDSWPDFHLTITSSNAIDRGVVELPDSLSAMLKKFGILDPHWGLAYDIGRHEGGFTILPSPITWGIDPGGFAIYTLRLFPTDLPFPVTLTVFSPDPQLVVSIEPTIITSDSKATLTITSTHAVTLPMPGVWYSVQLSGEGEGSTNQTTVHLLVGGTRDYFPLTAKNDNP